MKIKELTLSAVIPTAQYANLQPSVTIEVNDDFDAAKKEALRHISQFSSDYAENGKAIGTGAPTVKKLKKMVPDFGDVDLFFDKEAHAYCDAEGNVYESGSKFAKRFEQPFDANLIIPKYAAKFEVTEQDVRDFWKAKSESSTTFGTALHQALETYGKFAGLALQLSTEDKEVTTGINPTLLPIVRAFFTLKRQNEVANYEPFVVDSANKRCGQIDRLVIVDANEKICDIEDYKTNADLFKQNSPKFLKEPYNTLLNQPISGYKIQLNFYRTLMEANGWTVRDLLIHHWDGKSWTSIKLDKVEI